MSQISHFLHCSCVSISVTKTVSMVEQKHQVEINLEPPAPQVREHDRKGSVSNLSALSHIRPRAHW